MHDALICVRIVAGLPSSHAEPITPGMFGQLSEQSSTPSPSVSVVTGVPAHTPDPEQTSFTVQGSLSSQAVPAGAAMKTQPVAGSQESIVQGSPSSQTVGEPPMHWQLASRTSLLVQALPSLQGAPGNSAALVSSQSELFPTEPGVWHATGEFGSPKPSSSLSTKWRKPSSTCPSQSLSRPSQTSATQGLSQSPPSLK